MPSPKNKTRRSKSKSPRNSTRVSPRAANFPADPFLDAMMRGDLLWGDLLYDEPVGRSRSPTPRAMPTSPENPVFENFVTPDLRLKKFIWEHFPVVLEEIPSGGKEMYAIKWHKKNLEEWRSSRTTSWDEAMEYQLFSELRLLHSLRKHPELYVLHEPKGKDEIAIVEMIGAARRRSPEVAAGAGAAGPAVPPLRKLNDITTHFPGVVVWEKVEGRKGESTYALKVRNDFARKVDPKIADRVLGDLEAALRASRFWAVLPPARGEFMRLEMRHD